MNDICISVMHSIVCITVMQTIISAMDFTVRDIRQDEYPLLEEFLYQAIYVPEGFEGAVPRAIVHDDPKCRAAYEEFGTLPDDRALVVEVEGKVVGACWARTTEEYGHVDATTPSLSISLFEDYRGQGIGTVLLQHMLDELHEAGYARTSLSVQKENPAVHLYKRNGFRIVGNGADETEWLMIRGLCEPFTAIETTRLILRPWLVSDANDLYALASDPDIGPIAGWPPHKSVDESAVVIETVLATPETYAVVLKETGELAGCAGFNAGEAATMPLGDGELELGYWMGKPYWGRGIATEAARAVVERGFADLGLKRIRSCHFDGNDRSRRVLDKLGFSHVRTERDVECKLLGTTHTVDFMDLARSAYEANGFLPARITP